MSIKVSAGPDKIISILDDTPAIPDEYGKGERRINNAGSILV
jgi:hypothetical protein